MKCCIKCGQLKPIEEFVKDKNKAQGVRNICKECQNRSKRKTPDKPKPKEGYKFCATCKRELPLSSFHIRKVQGKMRPCSYCMECERERDRARYTHVCEICGKEYRSGKKDSRFCKSCWVENFVEVGRESLRKYNAVPENNFWYGKQRLGEENPNYKPEKTDEEREKGRILPGYKEWQRLVFERDHYICQCCGYSKGGILRAHHMDSYDWCKDKRTDVDNGVTLCDNCHRLFHSEFGFGGNTKAQFDEFKSRFK